MSVANILSLLHEENNKLENMIVYGNVRCAISKPDFLSDGVLLTSGFFALLDVLAVRCNGIDYVSKHENYQDSNHIYFSKGSMVIVLDDKGLIGENIKVYGSSLKGVTIKKQYSKSYKDGVCAFAWTKVAGTWGLKPNKVLPFGVSDARGTVLEDCIISLANGYEFRLPEEADVAQEYYGVMNAESLSVKDITGGMEYTTDHVDVSKLNMNLVHRLEPVEESEYLDVVEDEVETVREKSRSYAISILNDVIDRIGDENDDGDYDYPGMASEEIVYAFIKEIATRYDIPLNGRKGVKGRDFVEELFDSLISAKFADVESGKEDNAKKMKFINRLRSEVTMSANVLLPENMEIDCFKNYARYAVVILGVVSGIGSESLISNFNSMRAYNEVSFDTWYWCLIRNPYICGLMGSGLSVVDCDRIYLTFAKPYDEMECKEFRDILICLEMVKRCSSRSTMILISEITSSSSVYPDSGKNLCGRNGAPFGKDVLEALTVMLGREIVMPPNMLERYKLNVPKCIDDLCEIGVLDTVNDYVMLSQDLTKEFEIYKTLINKGQMENDISDDVIERATEKFENKLGFKLEPLQKDGLKLTKYKAAVLSGCAGSGKTTTSDGMVTVFRESNLKYDLKFAAPSGKAARRLAESVEGDAKTIHSMFGIGVESEPLVRKNSFTYRRENKEGNPTVYFLDEMAMANTSLVYNIVRGLDEEDCVYFLGDIKQLQPIGKGSPFKAVMQFLPCVELGVSKRAAEKGKINYNVALVNFFSDDYLVELEEGDDFKIINCADADIPNKVLSEFKEYLNKGYDEDDIQVVTGFSTDKYTWGTINLNPMLQDMLRGNDDILFVHNNRKFLKGDRVIHVNRNSYEMQRYRRINNTVFEKVPCFGMSNGELGKIVGVLRSDRVTIEEINEDREYVAGIMGKYEAKLEALRDDSAYVDEKVYFVVVEVYDVEIKENVYVFYIGNYQDGLSNEFYARSFTGADLRCLDLAYALTTHKMQGSQSPVIILPVGSKGNAQFMNRNMLNTMITRASERVSLIGSISGRSSAFTAGRRVSSVDDCKDMLGFLSGV